MDVILQFYKRFQKAVEGVIGLTLVLIMVVIFVQTFTRYVVFYSLPWSEELSRYLFVFMIMLGINIGISKDMMVRIDLIDNFLPAKAKYYFGLVRDIVSLIAACYLFYSTIGMIKIGAFQKSPAMNIPMNIMYSIMFVGFLLAVFSVAVKIIERLRNK